MVYSITSLHKPAKPIPHTAPPYQQITYVRQSKNDPPTHNSTSSLIILANRQNAMNEKQNISKTSINTAFSVFGYKKSTRRDSNPRPSPWQGDTPPLSHSRILICTLKTAHKLFILKTSVHKRTFTKPHFVLSLLRNSVLFMIVRSLRFAELSNSHASMKFSNSGTTCELLYHFLP